MENLKTYSYDEASKTSLNYFAGDELAARVWVNKYAMKIAMAISTSNRPRICTIVWLTR